ncbi:hypothetical protein ACQKWADRAFT_287130 [Trichoderma austrokoningii]
MKIKITITIQRPSPQDPRLVQLREQMVNAFEEMLNTFPIMTVERLHEIYQACENGTENPMFNYVLFIGSRLMSCNSTDWDPKEDLRYIPTNWAPESLDDRFQCHLLKAITASVKGYSKKAPESRNEAVSLIPEIEASNFPQDYVKMMKWGYQLVCRAISIEKQDLQSILGAIRGLEIPRSCMSSNTIALLQHEKDVLNSLSEQEGSYEPFLSQAANEDQMAVRPTISHIALSASSENYFLMASSIKEDPKTFTPEINRSICFMLEYIRQSKLLSASDRVLNYAREYIYLQCLFALKQPWWNDSYNSRESFLCDAKLSYEFQKRFVRCEWVTLSLERLLNLPRTNVNSGHCILIAHTAV